MKTRLLTCALLLTLAAPPSTALETISPDGTLSGGSLAEFGTAIAVDGILAAVLSPGDVTIRIFTFDPMSQGWTVGPTISPPGAVGLGPAIAVSGFTIFYVAITDFGADPPTSQSWELRAQRVFLNPSTQTVVSFVDSAPASLAAAEDLIVAGIPRGDGTVSSYALIYGYNGSNWIQLALPGGTVIPSEYGAAVATNGFWTAITDPAQGDHGAVEVLILQAGQWVDWQVIEYDNPLQGAVGFGASLAIDEDCMVIGAPGYNRGFINPTSDTGAFMSYGLNSFGFWVLQETLVPEAALAGDRWGDAISIAGPNVVLGGKDVQRLNANPQGDAAVFRRSGTSCSSGTWSEHARLRATPLVIDPNAPADFGVAAAADEFSGVLIGDPMGPTGQFDGRAYAYSPSLLMLFGDGFESGDSSGWSATTP